MDAKIPILVVEDEETIREMVEQALAECGFAVAQASDGDRAIEMLTAGDAHYRGLVTDINLNAPVTGWDVARRGRTINPALSVVYMTGGNASEWASNGVPYSVLVTKPFAPIQIVTAISQLLTVGSTPTVAEKGL